MLQSAKKFLQSTKIINNPAITLKAFLVKKAKKGFYCFVFYVPLLGSDYIKYQDNQDIITIKKFLLEHNCRKTDFEIETSSSGELYNSNIFKCDDFNEELTEQDINFLLNIQNKN